MLDLNTLLDFINAFIMEYGLKIVGAIVTLIVGLWIIKHIVKLIKRAIGKSSVDDAVQQFLGSLVSVILKAALVIVIAGQLGVDTVSFVAILGAAGLAVGLALQGSLSNFAGGVLILIFKPYQIGDYIEAQGYSGTVKDIQIFNTILNTPDNKIIIIPNGPLSNGSITNYSTEPQRRVDMSFGIGYGDDIQKAKDVLNSLINSDERILKDPDPFLGVGELADSSVNITVRVWCQAADYWGIYFDMHENVKLQFDAAGISIPFPRQDVYVHQS